jgi:hypothetical protein
MLRTPLETSSQPLGFHSQTKQRSPQQVAEAIQNILWYQFQHGVHPSIPFF